jgi:hypothetical protein
VKAFKTNPAPHANRIRILENFVPAGHDIRVFYGLHASAGRIVLCLPWDPFNLKSVTVTVMDDIPALVLRIFNPARDG